MGKTKYNNFMRFAIPISFLIIIIVLFIAVINPFYNDVKQIKKDVSIYSTALNNSKELKEARDVLIEKYKNIKIEDKERLAHLLPSAIGNIELILEIEKIANLKGMPIKNIGFDIDKLEPKSKEESEKKIVLTNNEPIDLLPYGIFPIEFVVEGKYNVFVDFLKELELNLRLVDVKSISFAVPVSTDGPGNNIDPNIYSYKLKIETYWLK